MVLHTQMPVQSGQMNMLFSECDDRWQVWEELQTVLHWVRQPGPLGVLLEMTGR